VAAHCCFPAALHALRYINSGYDTCFISSSPLNRLKSGVEIWLNGSAESPLLYDKTWGGIVMCGCDFDDKLGICRNKYPDCPALTGTVIARTDRLHAT
jgi:hypothetical protein